MSFTTVDGLVEYMGDEGGDVQPGERAAAAATPPGASGIFRASTSMEVVTAVLLAATRPLFQLLTAFENASGSHDIFSFASAAPENERGTPIDADLRMFRPADIERDDNDVVFVRELFAYAADGGGAPAVAPAGAPAQAPTVPAAAVVRSGANALPAVGDKGRNAAAAAAAAATTTNASATRSNNASSFVSAVITSTPPDSTAAVTMSSPANASSACSNSAPTTSAPAAAVSKMASTPAAAAPKVANAPANSPTAPATAVAAASAAAATASTAAAAANTPVVPFVLTATNGSVKSRANLLTPGKPAPVKVVAGAVSAAAFPPAQTGGANGAGTAGAGVVTASTAAPATATAPAASAEKAHPFDLAELAKDCTRWTMDKRTNNMSSVSMANKTNEVYRTLVTYSNMITRNASASNTPIGASAAASSSAGPRQSSRRKTVHPRQQNALPSSASSTAPLSKRRRGNNNGTSESTTTGAAAADSSSSSSSSSAGAAAAAAGPAGPVSMVMVDDNDEDLQSTATADETSSSTAAAAAAAAATTTVATASDVADGVGINTVRDLTDLIRGIIDQRKSLFVSNSDALARAPQLFAVAKKLMDRCVKTAKKTQGATCADEFSFDTPLAPDTLPISRFLSGFGIEGLQLYCKIGLCITPLHDELAWSRAINYMTRRSRGVALWIGVNLNQLGLRLGKQQLHALLSISSPAELLRELQPGECTYRLQTPGTAVMSPCGTGAAHFVITVGVYVEQLAINASTSCKAIERGLTFWKQMPAIDSNSFLATYTVFPLLWLQRLGKDIGLGDDLVRLRIMAETAQCIDRVQVKYRSFHPDHPTRIYCDSCGKEVMLVALAGLCIACFVKTYDYKLAHAPDVRLK